MAKNIDRVLRIVDAAAALVQIEAAWNAGKGGRGSQAAKKALKAAYEDYMTHHAQDIKEASIDDAVKVAAEMHKSHLTGSLR